MIFKLRFEFIRDLGLCHLEHEKMTSECNSSVLCQPSLYMQLAEFSIDGSAIPEVLQIQSIYEPGHVVPCVGEPLGVTLHGICDLPLAYDQRKCVENRMCLLYNNEVTDVITKRHRRALVTVQNRA
jgi:hypothetical protein